MSSDEASSAETNNTKTTDAQMVFVTLLKDYVILFDKRMTPQVKTEKDKALQNLTSAFNLNTKQHLEPKQLLRKFNNMKTKVKKLTDLRRTGNKKIKLNAWQQNFLDLWHSNSENPILSKIPGAKSAGFKRSHVSSEDDRDEEDDASIKALTKTLLSKKIKAAEAITRAANAVEQIFR